MCIKDLASFVMEQCCIACDIKFANRYKSNAHLGCIEHVSKKDVTGRQSDRDMNGEITFSDGFESVFVSCGDRFLVN